MGRIKRDLSYVKPFCFYCDKVFANEIVLHQHQKAIHFRCPRCKSKFPTAQNLLVHFSKKHKSTLERIPQALRERQSVEVNIFGMNGVPDDFIYMRSLKKGKEYWLKVFNEKEQKRKNKLIEEIQNDQTV